MSDGGQIPVLLAFFRVYNHNLIQKASCSPDLDAETAISFCLEGKTVRRKKHLVLMMCLILLATSLAGCFLFGKDRNKETGADDQVQDTLSAASDSSAPSAAAAESSEPVSQTKPDSSAPTDNHPKETGAADSLEPSAETELPEIEITDAQDRPGAQSATPASTSSQSENNRVPEEEPGNSDIFISDNGDIMLPEVP